MCQLSVLCEIAFVLHNASLEIVFLCAPLHFRVFVVRPSNHAIVQISLPRNNLSKSAAFLAFASSICNAITSS
jgi:hypothetical protein